MKWRFHIPSGTSGHPSIRCWGIGISSNLALGGFLSSLRFCLSTYCISGHLPQSCCMYEAATIIILCLLLISLCNLRRSVCCWNTFQTWAWCKVAVFLNRVLDSRSKTTLLTLERQRAFHVFVMYVMVHPLTNSPDPRNIQFALIFYKTRGSSKLSCLPQLNWELEFFKCIKFFMFYCTCKM